MTSAVSDVTTAGPGSGQRGDEAADALSHDGRMAGGPARGGWSAGHSGPSQDQTAVVPARRRTVRSWPLLVLAAPAAVAVWSGWVGIGQMTGFGEIHPLPGIWDSLHLDTAVTLPIGVEAYAAFALRVWLTSSTVISGRTRRFARRSAIAALVLGMAGQVAYHLLAQAKVERAPWEVTTVVACLPVLVLGLGSALAHLLRGDSAGYTTRHQAQQGAEMQVCERATGHAPGSQECPIARPARDNSARPPARVRITDLQAAAATVIASGQAVSRRSLRSAGLHGSNADLGMLARRVRAQPRTSRPADS